MGKETRPPIKMEEVFIAILVIWIVFMLFIAIFGPSSGPMPTDRILGIHY